MRIKENISLNWSKEIPSDSQVRDALGIWTKHLKIQEDFTPGITSVTRRIRYYTLLAWYWENLYPGKIINLTDYEKIFILTCLAHHDGDYNDPRLSYVFNKQAFKGKWNETRNLNLNFKINGFGRIYYTRQLEILKCAWTDMLNRPHTSLINKKLASSLDTVPIEIFKKKSFTKEELKRELANFCICNTEHNEKEKEIMSKLLFGFFTNRNGEWDIDEEEYNLFMKGGIELDFKEKLPIASDPEYTRQLNLRRRNTLFMFLKIIKETTPPIQEFRRYIWDAIYFKQNRGNHKYIEFEKLEKIRRYWEYFQLNVYYVYALEKLLDIIQKIVANNNGIRKQKILSILNNDAFYEYLSKRLKHAITPDSKISDIIYCIEKLNKNKRTSLDSKINESQTYDSISVNANLLEIQLANILIMLCLLYNRYSITPEVVRKYISVNEGELAFDPLVIHNVFTGIEKCGREKNVFEYLTDLAIKIINKHLFEAARRLSWGTRNWIFTEEDERLFFARREYVLFQPRDNRWLSIKSLLKDLQFIEEKDSKIVLTEKGQKWLSKIE